MSTSRVLRYTREDLFPIGAFPLYLHHSPHEGDFPAHDHDFVELQLVLCGTGQHVTAFGVQPMTQGSVIVMRPGLWHAYRDCVRLEVYNCCFGVELLRGKLAWVLEDPALRALLLPPPQQRTRHSGVVAQLDPGALTACVAQFDLLRGDLERCPAHPWVGKVAQLALILDRLGGALPSNVPAPAPLPHQAAAQIAQATALLEGHIAHAWTSAVLAQRLGWTPPYFVRVFRASTGYTPLTFLAHLRAERAAELLIRTDLSIEHIALEVGWPSASYFARCFKAHHGMSARTYRQKFGQPGLDRTPGHRHLPRFPAHSLEQR